MADEKVKHADLLAYLKDNPPPDDIVVTVEFGGGKETDFHFQRSFLAYDRYIKEISRTAADEGPNALAIATTFLMDSIKKDEREALSALLNAYPGHATRISNSLLAVYSGDLVVTVKNGSRPAGP